MLVTSHGVAAWRLLPRTRRPRKETRSSRAPSTGRGNAYIVEVDQARPIDVDPRVLPPLAFGKGFQQAGILAPTSSAPGDDTPFGLNGSGGGWGVREERRRTGLLVPRESGRRERPGPSSLRKSRSGRLGLHLSCPTRAVYPRRCGQHAPKPYAVSSHRAARSPDARSAGAGSSGSPADGSTVSVVGGGGGVVGGRTGRAGRLRHRTADPHVDGRVLRAAAGGACRSHREIAQSGTRVIRGDQTEGSSGSRTSTPSPGSDIAMRARRPAFWCRKTPGSSRHSARRGPRKRVPFDTQGIPPPSRRSRGSAASNPQLADPHGPLHLSATRASVSRR